MFVQQQRFGNYSSGDNSDEDVSEGDVLQVNNSVDNFNCFKDNGFLPKNVLCTTITDQHFWLSSS